MKSKDSERRAKNKNKVIRFLSRAAFFLNLKIIKCLHLTYLHTTQKLL